MKRILYIICCVGLLLASCSDEALPNADEAGSGFLSLAELTLEQPGVEVVSSRADAEDTALTIEIWKGETRLQQLSQTEVASKIKLDAGTDYVLKVYSANYGNESSWTNADLGSAVYYAEKSFAITEGATTYLTVDVPMLVFGVQLSLPDNFNTWFPTNEFTVTYGNRSLTLTNGQTVYFSYVEGNTLSYKLTLTNTDGESQATEGTYGSGEGESVKTGSIYQISYVFETASLAARRK